MINDRFVRSWLVMGLFGCVLLGCRRPERSAGGQGAAGAGAAPASAAQAAPSTGGDPQSPLTDHDPDHRRRWARALARRANEIDRAPLLQLLFDADPQVVAWAAFGLGRSCTGQESETLRALVTRAASLTLSDRDVAPTPTIDPELALSLAISRCPSPKTERTLLAWIGSKRSRASAAALGLARLAEQQGRLEDDSLVGLLNVASRDSEPIPIALLAMDRLASLDTAVASRLTRVGESTLAHGGADRVAAILGLGRGDAAATSVLAKVVADPALGARDRTLAVRALGRRGEEGQTTLRELLGKIAPVAGEQNKAPWVVVLALLRSLSPPVPGIKPVLEQLAGSTIDDSVNAGERHREVLVRCWAASLLADTKSDGPRLLGCDPDPQGISGKLALLEVLDRGKINGQHYTQWTALARSESPRLRSAALKLIGSHSEIDAIPALLIAALEDAEPGTVATAAELLSLHPELAEAPEARGGALIPDPKLIAALTHAFERAYPPDQIAARSALLEAAGALKLLSLKSKVEECCHDSNRTLQRKAKHALEMLGDTVTACDPPKAAPLAIENDASPPASKPITLVFETTSGTQRIFLRPDLAPASVARLVELVGSGFYDKMPIHRAVPGYVVQFGDPKGDGYGGSGRAPLISEPSPIQFGAFSVGMADAGRDSASSQIFITLVPAPTLDGEYTYIGTADESWQNVVLDDVIERVLVE